MDRFGKPPVLLPGEKCNLAKGCYSNSYLSYVPPDRLCHCTVKPLGHDQKSSALKFFAIAAPVCRRGQCAKFAHCPLPVIHPRQTHCRHAWWGESVHSRRIGRSVLVSATPFRRPCAHPHG